MSDTIPYVGWSLERKCVFRTGENWAFPHQTFLQLIDLRTVAEAAAKNEIFDGICITDWSVRRDLRKRTHRVPECGFRVEDRLGAMGGLAAVNSTCGACEANVRNKLGIAVAGCSGALVVSPYSPERDEQLWSVIQERGLKARLRAAFPVTTPLWFGFWIESPLRKLQAELLHELLSVSLTEKDLAGKEMGHFLQALHVAIAYDLPMHVRLAPPGHYDFGVSTTFPHCPRCKAQAEGEEWQTEYSKEPEKCTVCGQTYIPNETYSRREDDEDDKCIFECDSLESQLGTAACEELVRNILRQRGCTTEQIQEVIDNKP